ncbi:hypothetical protein MGN70_014035 [Eutypa lata]|nr:hypothetical protein MGN70_014035 [Eutypa lata]
MSATPWGCRSFRMPGIPIRSICSSRKAQVIGDPPMQETRISASKTHLVLAELTAKEYSKVLSMLSGRSRAWFFRPGGGGFPGSYSYSVATSFRR